ncbi:MAG: TVP38/TMEM64 family protein [Elusimicrobia bacterium]|nr:TVP38/TMEM64 family protein [Elusimicrobiota bacterium]
MSRKAAASFLALLVLAALFWAGRQSLEELDPLRLLEALAQLRDRWWLPLAFIAAYAALCAVGVPGTVPTLLAGATWGPLWGTLYNVIGSNLGAGAAFWVGRSLGRDWMERFFGDALAGLERRLEKNGFQVILSLRLIPIFPFNMINFAAGLSSVRYSDYAAASLLGMLPATFIYTYLADSLLKGAIQGREAFGRVAVAGALLLGLSLLPRFYRRFIGAGGDHARR